MLNLQNKKQQTHIDNTSNRNKKLKLCSVLPHFKFTMVVNINVSFEFAAIFNSWPISDSLSQSLLSTKTIFLLSYLLFCFRCELGIGSRWTKGVKIVSSTTEISDFKPIQPTEEKNDVRSLAWLFCYCARVATTMYQFAYIMALVCHWIIKYIYIHTFRM